MKKRIFNINSKDKVFGTDGKYHKQRKLPIHFSKSMYKIFFENENIDIGYIKCSGDHLWNLYSDGICYTTSTDELYLNHEILDLNVGIPDGPKIKYIKKIKNTLVRCLEIDSEDHQFLVYTNKNYPIYTHNCQYRMVCGRVDSIASMMALGNTMGTTINGSIPGKAIIRAQGEMTNLQVYFAQQTWIENWFAERGLNKKGYIDSVSNVDEIVLEDNIEVDQELETKEFNFNDISKIVSEDENQNFIDI